MNTNLKISLDLAKKRYCDFMSNEVGDFWENHNFKSRRDQIDVFQEIILEHFQFDEINLIETGVSGNIHYGLFGFFLGAMIENFGGQMHSVDLDCNSCKSSDDIFSKNIPNLKYKTYCQDSVSFLKNPPIIPNIVHLDSYDFQLYNPFPSALHAWKEFESIKNLVPVGGIIIIDDNWLSGTFLQWIQNGQDVLQEITYPIIGKGANIYNEVLENRTNYELIGNHHKPYSNIKVYLKRIK
jgi:hypothetical protein